MRPKDTGANFTVSNSHSSEWLLLTKKEHHTMNNQQLEKLNQLTSNPNSNELVYITNTSLVKALAAINPTTETLTSSTKIGAYWFLTAQTTQTTEA